MAVGTYQGVAGLAPRLFTLEEETGSHHGHGHVHRTRMLICMHNWGSSLHLPPHRRSSIHRYRCALRLQVRALIEFRPPPSKHICGGVSPWGETGMSRRPKSVPPRAEKFPKGAAARRLIAKEAVATQSQNPHHIQQTTRFTYASIYTCSHVAAAARPRGPRRPRRKPDST